MATKLLVSQSCNYFSPEMGLFPAKLASFSLIALFPTTSFSVVYRGKCTKLCHFPK